jgi:hypothetical protein
MTELLARELNSAGLGIDAATRSVVTSMILHRGEVEFDRLHREICELDRYEESAIRTLGVGCSLTQFATCNVPVQAEYAAELRALGGLANLIVSAFDAMLDSGAVVPTLLSDDARGDRTHNESREAMVLRKLVTLYFQRLDSFPQVHKGIRVLIHRAIRRMYEAELDSVSGMKVARSTWWRKNVLPIVVMGFPVWLTVGRFAETEARRHLRWLCRVGEFFGWIDDCVDLESDELTGQPNRIADFLQRGSKEDLAHHILRQGRAILSAWNGAGVQPSRDIFMVMVWTWLEGASAAQARSAAQ